MSAILGIECASSSCSVALLSKGEIISSDKVTLSSGYPEILVPMIQRVVNVSGIDYRDIDIFASSVGAGSFTGVRVGLATARAMALSLGKRSSGVSNFVASAYMVPFSEREKHEAILVALETRREDFYVQFFLPDLRPFSSPFVSVAKGFESPFKDILLVGDGITRFQEASRREFSHFCKSVPDAQTICFWTEEHKDSLPEARPLYVSEAHVTVNR